MMPDNIKIRFLERADVQALIALKKTCFPGIDSKKESALWEWKYFKNPFWKAGWPTCFILERDGQLIGSNGAIPAKIKIGEKIFEAAVACDFMVMQRSASFGLILKNEFLNFFPFSLSTSVTKKAALIHKFLGVKEIPGSGFVFQKVLRSCALKNYYLRERNKAAKAIKLCLFYLILIPLSVFLKAEQFFRSVFFSDKEIREVSGFSADFENFWNRVSGNFKVCMVRDLKYLNWRYLSHPFKKYRIMVKYDKTNQIAGFVIFELVEKDRGAKKIKIMELLSLDLQTAAALLDRLIKEGYANGASLISSMRLTPDYEKLLKKYGFFRFNQGIPRYFYKDNTGNPGDLIENIDHWLVSFGDGDGDIY